MSDIIYFELNNWFEGRHYPNAEPFLTWCGKDYDLYFCNEEWVVANKLCVATTIIDMSVNFCITATKEWVEQNCPKLLSDKLTTVVFLGTGPDGEHRFAEEHSYSEFLRYPDKNGDIVGRFGTAFLEYNEENIGVHWM